MAEEDSFVILGTSPLSSICSHGNSLLTDALDKETTEKAVEAQQSADVKEEAPASINQLSAIPEQMNSTESSLPTTLPSGQSSLAASFLMGEVQADVLKVYIKYGNIFSNILIYFIQAEQCLLPIPQLLFSASPRRGCG